MRFEARDASSRFARFPGPTGKSQRTVTSASYFRYRKYRLEQAVWDMIKSLESQIEDMEFEAMGDDL